MRHLRYFLTVAREGSVSAAARELRIAQPSLSQQLRKLERRVGADLFYRTAQGLSLTAAGRRFLETIEGVPALVKSAAEAAALSRQSFTISVCSGMTLELVDSVREALLGHPGSPHSSAHPPSLDLRVADPERMANLLEHGELDFAIVRLPLRNPRMLIAQIADEELGIAVGKQHPFATRASVSIDDLQAHRLLLFDLEQHQGCTRALLTQLETLGWSPEVVHANMSQPILVQHALHSSTDLVSLRPRSITTTDRTLSWARIEGTPQLRERFGLMALQSASPAKLLLAASNRRGWPLSIGN
ncbi:LysR family transcriptional regulator [Nocardia sp.]|uniref:LysR family transcriptional regulator n=1 Tax=Nocardia sp. TaxID=1821 RepID=UPI0026069237|nr:LysR family transcriptional regulator [Nocardia sp.]